MSSSFTPAQLTALTNAIAQGVLEVEHNGKKIRYASISTMIKLRDRMKLEIESGADVVPRPLAHRTVFFRT